MHSCDRRTRAVKLGIQLGKRTAATRNAPDSPARQTLAAWIDQLQACLIKAKRDDLPAIGSADARVFIVGGPRS